MISSRIYPSTILQPYVQHFLLIENSDNPSNTTTFKVVADGCPGLIFQEHEGAFRSSSGAVLPQLFLHGLTTTCLEKTAGDRYSNIVMCLQPHALKSIFGIDAHLLTNEYVDLNSCMKNSLIEQLLSSHSVDDKIAMISNFLADQVIKNQRIDHKKISFIIQQIKNSNGAESIREIRANLNVSERLLERIMQSYVGISPKLFSRICRFQAAMDHLSDYPFELFTRLAYEYVYADQSH